MSNRHMIARNKLLSKDIWETYVSWRKMVKLGEEQIGGKVWGEIRRPEYIEYSIENWKNDDRKLMDALEKCKLHGGPALGSFKKR